MEPENTFGNVEYKLKLVNKEHDRIKHLATQMRFRCEEGNGESIYVLGVSDSGVFHGLTNKEYTETIQNINQIALHNNYCVTLLNKTKVNEEKNVYEVLVREINDKKYIDIKCTIAGSVDSGKTTFVGTITSGVLDNGRGLSRMSVFNYIHEVKTGRTSSISHEILGFDYKGNIINYQSINKPSWNEIVQRSSKIISFFDLCGHEKYLKTTIRGLSSSLPNICIIMISANNGLNKITKEHIFLCLTLKIPFVFVISKIDLCKERQNVLKETIDSLNKLLNHSSVSRRPFHIKNHEDIILSVKNIYSLSIAPIFQMSNVTGEGMENIRMFLNLLGENSSVASRENVSVEFFIDNLFNVKGVGVVIGGHLQSGTIRVGDSLLLGPKEDGNYESVIVKSLHCKKVNVLYATAGSYVCISFKKIDKKIIRRGLAVISPTNMEALSTMEFLATITVMRSHATTVKIGYEPLLCCNSIRQVVRILDISDKQNFRDVSDDDDKILRTNDTGVVKLQFKYRPEYLKSKSRFILCEGNLKIVGEVL